MLRDLVGTHRHLSGPPSSLSCQPRPFYRARICKVQVLVPQRLIKDKPRPDAGGFIVRADLWAGPDYGLSSGQ
jgi:hypothetical protein